MALYGSGRKICLSDVIGTDQIISHTERELGAECIPGIETPIEARKVVVVLSGIKDESGIKV